MGKAELKRPARKMCRIRKPMKGQIADNDPSHAKLSCGLKIYNIY